MIINALGIIFIYLVLLFIVVGLAIGIYNIAEYIIDKE